MKEGDEIAIHFKNREEVVEKLAKLFINEKWLSVYDGSESERLLLGLDGSNQLIGGLGGIFYIPWSVALVYIFPDSTEIETDILTNISQVKAKMEGDKKELSFGEDMDLVETEGDIFKVKGNERKFVRSKAQTEMLNRETNMMITVPERIEKKNLNKNKSSLLIDGPLVDPPRGSSKDYVSKRCKSIKKIVGNQIPLMGITKRIKEGFYLSKKRSKINEIESSLARKVYDKGLIYDDRELFTCLCTELSTNNTSKNGPFFTDFINLSNWNEEYKKYSNEGIKVRSFYYKFDLKSPVIRVDVPKSADFTQEEYLSFLQQTCLKGLDEPLPIRLAHEKCKITQSCADALGNEIKNRGAHGSPKIQISNELMR